MAGHMISEIVSILRKLPDQALSALASQWPSSWRHATPTLLTLFRLVAGPLVFLSLLAKLPFLAWTALVLFILGALTDYLDGFLARLWRAESWLGQVLDPVADKVLVASVLIGLIAFGPTNFWINLVVYSLLIRELLVSGLRESTANQSGGKGQALAVSILGKIKTTFQMIAITVLLAENAAGMTLNLGYWILSGAMVLSMVSLVEYLVAIVRSQMPEKPEQQAQTVDDADAIEAKIEAPSEPEAPRKAVSEQSREAD